MGLAAAHNSNNSTFQHHFSALPHSSRENLERRPSTWATTDNEVTAISAPHPESSFGLIVESACHNFTEIAGEKKKARRSCSAQGDFGGGEAEGNGRDKNAGPVVQRRNGDGICVDPFNKLAFSAKTEQRMKGSYEMGMGMGEGRLEEESQRGVLGEKGRRKWKDVAVNRFVEEDFKARGGKRTSASCLVNGRGEGENGGGGRGDWRGRVGQ